MTRRLQIAFLLLFALLSLRSACAAPADPRVAIVLVTPPATLEDWDSAPAPHLHQLLEQGGIALMNTRAARVPGDRSRESVASAALTLGAGARAACGACDGVFTPVAEMIYSGVTTQTLFARRTQTLARDSDLVALNWPRIVAANRNVGYHVSLGTLGSELDKAGVQVIAAPGPYAPLIAALGDGTVAAMSATDFLATVPQHDCAAFLDAPADWRGADALIASAMAYAVQREAILVVLSPAVNDREYEAGNRLAPIVVFEPKLSPGLLTGRSTRTPGLIASTDFAPALVSYFEPHVRGDRTAQPWSVQPQIHPQGTLSELQQKSQDQRQGMKALPVFAILAGLLVIVATILQMRGVNVPAGLILLPVAAIWTFAMAQNVRDIFFFGIAPLGLLITLRRVGSLRVLRWICLLIWAAAIVHMLAPHGLLKYSLLGYSIIEGARYYGIGNEMMGALAGAMLIAATSAQSTWARRLMFACVLATVGIVGWPQIGAKAGGVIVSVGTLLVYFGSLRGVRWSFGKAALVIAAAIAAVLAVAYVDSHLSPGRQSHLGRAFAGLQSAGGAEWMDIVARKLSVEGRLLWHSTWALPLWGSLAGIVLLRRSAANVVTLPEKALDNAGLAAILLSIAFNDAGAVAGALCAMLLWSRQALMTTGSQADPRSAWEPASA